MPRVCDTKVSRPDGGCGRGAGSGPSVGLSRAIRAAMNAHIIPGYIDRDERSWGAGNDREAGRECPGGGDGVPGGGDREAVRALCSSGLLSGRDGNCLTVENGGRRQRSPWSGPAEGDKAGQGTGASVLRGRAEGAGPVQPREETTERGPD